MEVLLQASLFASPFVKDHTATAQLPDGCSANAFMSSFAYAASVTSNLLSRLPGHVKEDAGCWLGRRLHMGINPPSTSLSTVNASVSQIALCTVAAQRRRYAMLSLVP